MNERAKEIAAEGRPESEALAEKIAQGTVRVGVVGLGYVGLALACEFAKGGIRVLGFDIDQRRVDAVKRGETYITDVRSETLKDLGARSLLEATREFDRLAEVDAVSICVPTPLRKAKDPDISYIVAATEEIARRLRPGQLVVLESTTYPGTTVEVILPRLEKSGLKVGRDFFLAFSPERVDPANTRFTTKNTPKVVGGVTATCAALAKALYEKVIDRVVPVSSTSAAEMVKLLENTFRIVNIGLVNETAIMCDKLGLDVWEVIDAAATKPFGFMPFYPGPGLGGHCIPVDPHYLAWKLKTLDYTARFIELAGEINAAMPHYVVQKVADALNDRMKSLKGSKVFVLGAAYKKDTNDARESPALDIIRLLLRKGSEVSYHDPFIGEVRVEDGSLRSTPLDAAALSGSDCVVIVTDHSMFDYAAIVRDAPVVVDTRNATRAVRGRARKVITL